MKYYEVVKPTYGVFKTIANEYVAINGYEKDSMNQWDWKGITLLGMSIESWHIDGYYYRKDHLSGLDLVHKVIALPKSYMTTAFIESIREILRSVDNSDFFEPLLFAHVMKVRKQRSESLRNRNRTYHFQYDLL